MTPDHINAVFELGGSVFIWMNVRRLYRDKLVRGVYAPVVGFYTLWGFWNCYFYPAVGQTLSFYAGAAVTLGNLVWCALAVVYTRREQRALAEAAKDEDHARRWREGELDAERYGR